MILVDELRIWPHARRPFLRGSCHLMSDDVSPQGLAALHEFAALIGLRCAWFQDHPLVPHYDLTPGRRIQALAAGAVFVSALQQQARDRRKAREARETPP